MVSIVVGPTESKRIIGGMWVGEGWVWTELMGAIVYVGERYCSGVGSWRDMHSIGRGLDWRKTIRQERFFGWISMGGESLFFFFFFLLPPLTSIAGKSGMYCNGGGGVDLLFLFPHSSCIFPLRFEGGERV